MKYTLACLSLISALTAGFPGVYASDTDSFSLPDELINSGKHLVAEAKEFTTTPFQVENGNLYLTFGVAGAIGTAYIFDGELKDIFQKNRSRNLDKATGAGSLVGDPFLHLGLATLFYGGGVLAESDRWKETGELLGEALILADASTLILKEAIGRGRPSVTMDKSDFSPFGFKSSYDSFPSMHTASSFAVASVLAQKSDSIPIAVMSYSAAAFVAFSRLSQNKHWASDVLLGAVIGELSGRVVTSFHASHAKQKRVVFLPSVNHSGTTINLLYSF